MKATSISVNVRYSRPLPDGSYKTVELGCEATLTSSGEDWQIVQQDLYHQLGEQLRYVFAQPAPAKAGVNGNDAQDGHRIDAQPAQEPTQSVAPPHYCTEHNIPFDRRVNKDTGREFYSHRQDKGWHNE